MDSRTYRLMERAATARQKASGSGAVASVQLHPFGCLLALNKHSKFSFSRVHLSSGDTDGFHILNGMIIIL